MEYKRNKKKFPLAFKKKVGEGAVANKRKLEAEKPADVWNAKKLKWTKPNSQIGYKAMTALELFSDMKQEKCDSPDFKSCVQFVRCEELLVTKKFETEANAVGSKFCVVGAGAPRKYPSVRKKLFDFFIDIRSSLRQDCQRFSWQRQNLYTVIIVSGNVKC